MLRMLGWAGLVSFLWMTPARAAGDADEAEVNFQLGAKDYLSGRYEDALSHFLASNRLSPNRNVAFNIARAYDRLGKYPEAYRWYQEAYDDGSPSPVLATIEKEMAAMSAKVALIDVTANPAGAAVYFDRRDLGAVGVAPGRFAVDPGLHTLLIEAPGHRPKESQQILFERGTSIALTFELEAIVGRIQIDAGAGTAVHLGDASAPVLCTSPCEVALPPGSQLLVFTQEGFKQGARSVQVVENQTSALAMDLVPVTGTLVVDADERGALVEVDGVSRGFTPVVVDDVPVGPRTVRISKPGFEPVAQAVEVGDGTQTKLTEIVLVPLAEVNAVSRLPERVEEAPSSVTIITRQEIEAFGYPTIYEAVRGVRGTSLAFDTTYDAISVRGIGSAGDFGNKLLITSDGAVLNDNILSQSFIGYDARVDLGDVSRIELVRGAGSVLYGTGAVSGVLNLVGTSNEDPTTVELAVGAIDQVGRARGAMHVGSEGGETGMRASVSAARSDGYEMTIADGSGGTVVDGVDSFEAGTTVGRVWVHDVTAQWFLTTRSQAIPTGAYGSVIGDDSTVWQDTRGLLELRYEPQLSSTLQLMTRAHANYYEFDGTYVFEGETPGSTIDTFEVYRGLWGGLEGRIVAEPSTALRISAGGELQQSLEASLYGYEIEDVPDNVYLDEDSPYVLGAVYALADVSPSDALKVSAGARLDYWSTFGVTVNPRLAFIVKATDDDIVKLMGGRAFRAPSVYELTYNDGGYTQVRSDYDGTQLEAETVWSSELEYTHAFTPFVSALASVYGSVANNLVDYAGVTVDDTEVSVYRNFDSAVNTLGGDVEVRRSFHRGSMWSASYGLLAAVDAGSGERMPGAPSQFGSTKLVVPVLDPAVAVAGRLTLEGPRRISSASDRMSDPAVVGDLVLSGKSPSGTVEYRLGLYNAFDWDYRLPVAETFPSPTLPQRGRSLLAEVELKRF